MMSSERQEEGIHKDDVLEVVDQAFAVEKVIGAEQEIPTIRNTKMESGEWTCSITCDLNARIAFLYPDVPVHGAEQWEFLFSARNIGQEDDLLVDKSLYQYNQQNHKQGSCRETSKESSNHDKCPQCSNSKIGSLDL